MRPATFGAGMPRQLLPGEMVDPSSPKTSQFPKEQTMNFRVKSLLFWCKLDLYSHVASGKLTLELPVFNICLTSSWDSSSFM